MMTTRQIVLLLMPAVFTAQSKYEPTDAQVTEISSMMDSSVSLPCNMTSNIPGDAVRLVLWFRQDKQTPVYSLDSRDKSLPEARHWSDDAVFEGRAFYQSSHNPGRLVIDQVKIYDQGLYKCRVDFKIQPTTISQVNLTINTPPGKPVILDEAGSEVRLKLGPYKLGDSVMIKCLVVGGRPSPEVSWWRDHQIVDDTSVRPSEFKVENVFTLERLERSDLDSILTCQAKNSNESLPVSTSVKLDMTFGPETVELRGVRHSLLSGERYSLECRAVGSRPPPSISWRLGDSLINVLQTRLETSNDQNITTSTISLLAEPHHHGKTISCTAEVPGLEDSSTEATSSLNVHFISSARLSLGPSMRLEDVNEGDDVYLECEVSSNPRPDRISWYRNGEAVRQDVARGVILSNLTLVLQHVTSTTRGNYSCQADNSEGSVTSNLLPLDIKYKPVCSTDGTRKFQVGLNSQVEILCQVESNPQSELTFHWVFNTSKEMIDIQQDQMRVNGTASIVDYIPRTEMDYGSLLCWAENSLGRQSRPCVFQLVPAPPPLLVTTCEVTDHAITSVSVDCQTLKASDPVSMTFVLEVWRSEDNTLARNVTAEAGHWSVRGLEPGGQYTASVWTFNDVGASNRHNFSFQTFTSQYAESRVHIDSSSVTDKFSITPILGALIGVGVALSFVTITILVVVCCKSKQGHQSSHRSATYGNESQKELLSEDVAPRKISCLDDESGFEQFYSEKRYSSPHHQLCNKNIFIMDPAAREEKETDGTSREVQFRTLQHRRHHYDAPPTSFGHTYRSFTLQRDNWSERVSSSHSERTEHVQSPHDISESEVALLSPTSVPTISSTISSSELNHSLVSSDTSELSSERDRESEV